MYPGLKSHPQHDIATRQQNGYGAMITFYCVGGREQSAIVLKNVSYYMYQNRDMNVVLMYEN